MANWQHRFERAATDLESQIRGDGASTLDRRSAGTSSDGHRGGCDGELRTCVSAPKPVYHRYVLDSISALMPAGSPLSVLDAGCGNGFIATEIAEQGHRVTGIDSAPDQVALARAGCEIVRYEVRSVYDDLSDLMPAGGWDLIVSCEVIEHLTRPVTFLRNMNKHLRSRAAIIMTTPYHGYLKNLALSLADGWDRHHGVLDELGHLKFFSARTLTRALLESGFEPPIFRNAGRLPLLWKSMVCRSTKQN